ncbi:MAG: HAMP domain-containing histidine kinase [Bacteroidaceae bacterium]|nr:HAMP domain-containing histidine kinase [Bacteroidaceae bacterium]
MKLTPLSTSLLIVMLLVCHPTAILAQHGNQDNIPDDTLTYNNRYGIRDDLYSIFERAYRKRSSSECLTIADTLQEQAVMLKDGKSECLAHVIRINYFLSVKDDEKLAAEGNVLRETARRTGFTQYYYFAYSQEIVNFLSTRRLLEAKDMIEIMYNEALSENDYYGQALSLMQNGKLYQQRVNYSKAYEYYLKAAELYEEKVPSQSATSAYNMASLVCLKNMDFENALKHAEKGLSIEDNDPNIVIQLLDNKAVALFGLRRYNEFAATYHEIMDYQNRMGFSARTSTLSYQPLWEAYNGRYESAVKAAKSKGKSQSVFILTRMIREYMQDYKGALAESDTLHYITMDLYGEAIDEELNEMSTRLGNEKLKSENAELVASNERELALFRRRMIILVLLSSVVIISILTGSLIKSIRDSRKNREQNRLLQSANSLAVKARDRAERSERIQSVFIQNISHEIRTPLNAIVGFSQLLSDPAYSEMLTNEEKAEYSGLIKNNTEILTSLVNDILNLADIESGKLKTDISDFQCNGTCRDVMDSVRSYIKKGVTLKFESDFDDSFTIHSDRNRVVQILFNLLTNACKFTDKGDITIRCSLSEEPDRMTISVTDSGPGVPPEKADEIFERFTKLDSFKQGNGLGLPICKLLAGTLGGEVLLDVSYTDGARFLLLLPL